MLQGQEIIVILLVALVVLGPQRLPEMARKLGGWAAELRRAAREIRMGLEAEVADVKKVRDDVVRPLKDVTQTMTDARDMMDRASKPTTWVGPEPTRGPTSADAMEDLSRIEESAGPETGPTANEDRSADGAGG